MIQPPEDRRPAITPQLALRVAVLGGLALVLFGVIFFRLWFLQILSGNQYVAQANDNQIRAVRVQAPRGEIVDRNEQTLVKNRQATVVQVEPGRLPADKAERKRIYDRLGHVLAMRPSKIRATVADQEAALPYANATVKADVSNAVLAYIEEHQSLFPGVTVNEVYLREYPHHDVAAHLLGYVGQVNADELKHDPTFRGVTQGTTVGQAGIEYQYDRYLRGRDGADLLRINSLGDFRGFVRRRDPVPGHRLRLSLDLGLQKAAQDALLRAGGGNPGAFVALDPNDGEVLAMGSYPTFDPSVFVPAISRHDYKALTSKANGAPLIDRAIQGGYPTGSTFKPITALAAQSAGVLSSGEVFGAGACTTVGDAQRCNAGKADLGAQDLTGALRVSSDVYFYQVGVRLSPLPHEPLQRWARRLGLGHKTGIDLPAEQPGLVPDRAWRAKVAGEELRCEHRKHISFPPGCGISDGRPWSEGDEVNLAIGQGDLLADPLQMAVAYSTIENGGRVVRPHLGLAVEDNAGRLLQTIDEPPARRIHIPSAYLDPIRTGLHEAASQPGGTSFDVFQGWPQTQYPVYGKTGTAQHNNEADQSWYVCYVPAGKRSIVVAVTIERGGFGASEAAPAARLILSKWFGVKPKFVAGSSHTL